MVITQEVEIKIFAKNIDWYRQRGYECNKKDVIKVKVGDLSKGTHIKIWYQCDRCLNLFETEFSTFARNKVVTDKTYCRECANILIDEKRHLDIKEFLEQDGYKKCNECNRVLPADTDHFNLRHDTFDGFVKKCKECIGRKFTDYLTRIPKDNHKFCIKCDKELPVDIQYFPPDKTCTDGFRNVCRACINVAGNYEYGDYSLSEKWSDEDIQLLKEKYPYYTGEELMRNFFPNRTVRAIESQAGIYGCEDKTHETVLRSYDQRAVKTSKKLKGRKVSKETRYQISESLKEYYKTNKNHQYGKPLTEAQRKKISDRLKKSGAWKGASNPRHKKPLYGENNGNWKGGITPLYFELRNNTREWQQNSIEFCNHRCIITGGKFNNVHHLTPFRDIVVETFDLTELGLKQQMIDYTINERLLIIRTLKQLHTKYGYGACLNKQVHQLFHRKYGYRDNTLEQFIEFINCIHNGRFNSWFDKNNISINIDIEFIDYLKSLSISNK